MATGLSISSTLQWDPREVARPWSSGTAASSGAAPRSIIIELTVHPSERERYCRNFCILSFLYVKIAAVAPDLCQFADGDVLVYVSSV